MAASKSKNTGHSGRNTKKKTAMEQEVGRFQTEIILFVILAACVILMADRRSDLYFCHICFWNYWRICDHYTGICCMYDHYHTALSA